MRFKLSVLLLILSLLPLVVSCNNSNEVDIIGETIDSSQDIVQDFSEVATVSSQDPVQDFSEDAILLVDAIEDQHPIFLMEDLLPEDYDERRQAFLQQTTERITYQEFEFLVQRYIITLKDGHMMIRFGNQFLNVDWQYIDGHLFKVGENGETKEVIEISGLPVQDVVEKVAFYYYFENDVERQFLTSIISRDVDLLRRAGATIGVGMGDEVEITLHDGSNMIQENVSKRWGNLWNIASARLTPHNFIVRYELMDDIFYIDLRTFEFDSSIDEAEAAIEEAIENGTRHFIVDLRDNGGGNSAVGDQLLSAMGISPPAYGSVRRISQQYLESLEQFGITLADMLEGSGYDEAYIIERGYLVHEPSLEMANNPNDVFISVLTNIYTYSSATMFGIWVQDGNFGNIIGETSRNAPSVFGDMMGAVTLPESQMNIRISTSKFIRPDTEADQNMLVPDILVDSEDALDTAIEFLDNLRSE